MKPIQQWTTTDFVDFVKSVDKKTWIKVGIGAVISAVIFAVFVWPAWFVRADLKKKIQSVESQIVRLETLRRKKMGWLSDKEQYQKFIEEITQRLYLPGETSLLLGAISKLGAESHASVIASRPHADITEFPAPFNTRYEANLYDFTVEGGYHELGDFLSRIESNPKIWKVQLCHVNPREKSPQSHVVNLTLSVVSLKKNEDSGQAVVGAPAIGNA